MVWRPDEYVDVLHNQALVIPLPVKRNLPVELGSISRLRGRSLKSWRSERKQSSALRLAHLPS